MNKRAEADLQNLQDTKPLLRSVTAFIIWNIRPSSFSIDDAYKKADEFITRLEKDIRNG